MCIYCNTTNYRKIYENHYGEIPIDDRGMTYDIHHVDGNHSNNDPSNLRAISILDHYKIHYNQGDYGACFLIASQRLNLSKQELIELNRKQNLKRLSEGTHNWTTEYLKKFNKDRVDNGTHPFLGSYINDMMKENGTHPSLFAWTCEYCGKEGLGKSNYNKYHGNNCLKHPDNIGKKREPNNFTTNNPNSNFEWTCTKCNFNGRGIYNFERHVDSKKCLKNQSK